MKCFTDVDGEVGGGGRWNRRSTSDRHAVEGRYLGIAGPRS